MSCENARRIVAEAGGDPGPRRPPDEVAAMAAELERDHHQFNLDWSARLLVTLDTMLDGDPRAALSDADLGFIRAHLADLRDRSEMALGVTRDSS